jgi:hypothetical protein
VYQEIQKTKLETFKKEHWKDKDTNKRAIIKTDPTQIYNHILNFGTTCRGMVSFMLWPFYPYGKRVLYLLNKRLDELQC